MWKIQSFKEQYAVAVDAEQPCLLLPGWSFDADIFEWLLPGLAQHFMVSTAQLESLSKNTTKDQLVDALAQSITQPTWLIGWSMGGNIAIEIAHRYPEKVLGLCLLSTTPSFIKKDDWLVGISQEAFDAFQDGVSKDCAKTLHKFDLLQTQGDPCKKDLRHSLGQYRKQQQQLTADELFHGLTLLGGFDQRSILRALDFPMLWCFGELDALVNPYAAYEIKTLCPLAEVEVFRQCTHPLFLTNPDKFFKSLLHLLNKDKIQIEKQKVAASFSKAAMSYDSAATLQRSVAEQLLHEVEVANGFLLDAGCGTGYWVQHLAAKAESVIGLDMAHGMLQYGQSHFPHTQQLVESDLEILPFVDHSITQIFSSLAVQWCEDASIFLEEWYRVLKPGGKAYIATLGENTLTELRNSWHVIDGGVHVNNFLSVETLCEEVYQSPFALKKMHVESKVLGYDDVKSLMLELKNIGAQTVLNNEAKGLMGKQRFARLEEAYEIHRNEQKLLPATYEVIYMVLEKHL
jgi:malonyl-CoA O-methyltransferase